MIDPTDNRLESNLRFIDEFVPIEMIDGAQILLTDFLEFLLQIPFHLGDAAGFERTEIRRNDRRTQGGDRIRKERLRNGFLRHVFLGEILGRSVGEEPKTCK